MKPLQDFELLTLPDVQVTFSLIQSGAEAW